MVSYKKAFAQKLAWQKRDVRHFEDVLLSNQTDEKVVAIFARIVCNVYVRISITFGNIVVVNNDRLGNQGFIENITYTIFWKRNIIFTIKECKKNLCTRKIGVYIYAQIQWTDNIIIKIWLPSIENGIISNLLMEHYLHLKHKNIGYACPNNQMKSKT